jgi:hypothetical protein
LSTKNGHKKQASGLETGDRHPPKKRKNPPKRACTYCTAVYNYLEQYGKISWWAYENNSANSIYQRIIQKFDGYEGYSEKRDDGKIYYKIENKFL